MVCGDEMIEEGEKSICRLSVHIEVMCQLLLIDDDKFPLANIHNITRDSMNEWNKTLTSSHVHGN